MQGVLLLILLPRIVFVLTPSACRWDTLTPSQEMLLKPMCCRTACIALVLFTLNRKLASPVSRRDALNAELESLAQMSIKHSGPPRGPGDRIGGIAVRTETCLLVLLPFPSPT
jgi:hypothetical protein